MYLEKEKCMELELKMVKVRVIINLNIFELVKEGFLHFEPLPSQMTNETYSDCHRQAKALSHIFYSFL